MHVFTFFLQIQNMRKNINKWLENQSSKLNLGDLSSLESYSYVTVENSKINMYSNSFNAI